MGEGVRPRGRFPVRAVGPAASVLFGPPPHLLPRTRLPCARLAAVALILPEGAPGGLGAASQPSASELAGSGSPTSSRETPRLVLFGPSGVFVSKPRDLEHDSEAVRSRPVLREHSPSDVRSEGV